MATARSGTGNRPSTCRAGASASSRTSSARACTRAASPACAPTCAARLRHERAAGRGPRRSRHRWYRATAVRRCWLPARLAAAAPGPGEVRVRHTAIGVNYIDVYVRRGEYRMLEPPAPPGMEAAGVVLDVGEGVSHVLPGRPHRVRMHAAGRVCRRTYAGGRCGGRAARRRLRRRRRGADAEGHERRVPAASDASRARGRRRAGARGGRRRRPSVVRLGQGARRARHRYGIERRKGAGRAGARRRCRDRRTPTAASRTRSSRPTGGRGADVIYDGLGAPARDENLAALATCGHWIAYGQAGGAHGALDMGALSAKSATLSRPVLFHYTAPRARLRRDGGQRVRGAAQRRRCEPKCAIAIRWRPPPTRTAILKRGARSGRSSCCHN